MNIKETIRKNLIDCTTNKLTDKAACHSYEHFYPELLSSLFNKKINVLEIGVAIGGGLKFLHDSLPEATIYGVDITYESYILNSDDYKRIVLLPQSDQTSINLNLLPNLDLIIEDASHDLNLSIKTFELLKSKLNKNAIYVIEDVYPQYIDYYKSDGRFKLVDLTHIENRADDVLAVYFNQ